MTMILNESLRLYPPAVAIARKVAREVLELNISLLIVHHDTQLWGEDAHLFKPERFIEGVAGATTNTMSFLPFGAGPRYCVGQGLAMLEAKTDTAAVFLHSFACLCPCSHQSSYDPSPVWNSSHSPKKKKKI